MNVTDVSTGSTTSVALPSSSSVSDFGYVPTSGKFYGVRNGGTAMWIYDPVFNTALIQPLTGPITTASGGFGAVWVVNSGAGFYAFNNTNGNIYKIDLTTFASTLQTASTPNSANDGMACYDQNDPFTNPTADFGDAPDTYGTLGTSSGAGALVYPGLSMGTPADGDADGQPSIDATADTSDDGVLLGGVTIQDAPLPIGEAISITVNTASDAGFVSAHKPGGGGGGGGRGGKKPEIKAGNYTRDEWKKLGSEGQAKVRSSVRTQECALQRSKD